LIEEHHGLIATQNNDIIAHMVLPKWIDFQTPIWGYTYIISGKKQFIIETKLLFLKGQSIKLKKKYNIPILWRALWLYRYLQTCIFDRKS
jgi:hypothetical protein